MPRLGLRVQYWVTSSAASKRAEQRTSQLNASTLEPRGYTETSCLAQRLAGVRESPGVFVACHLASGPVPVAFAFGSGDYLGFEFAAGLRIRRGPVLVLRFRSTPSPAGAVASAAWRPATEDSREVLWRGRLVSASAPGPVLERQASGGLWAAAGVAV